MAKGPEEPDGLAYLDPDDAHVPPPQPVSAIPIAPTDEEALAELSPRDSPTLVRVPRAVPGPPSASTWVASGDHAPAAPDGALVPGALLDGRYRLQRRIGAGGSAVVFAADDVQEKRPVALKVMVAPAGAADRIARLQQEMRLSKELEHPNVVRVFDLGRDGDRHYLTMELLEGSDLRSLLGRPRALPEALRLLTHAAAGLAYAHAKDIVHRDVKPANLFLTKSGQLKLTDFGLARTRWASGLTRQGAIIGTPEYMAPEQVTGDQAISPATDIYALGVLAYELLTGALPFQHRELMPLLMKHVNEAPRPLRQVNPRIPEPFESLVLRMLAKSPKDRFESAGELREALLRLWPVALEEAARAERARAFT